MEHQENEPPRSSKQLRQKEENGITRRSSEDKNTDGAEKSFDEKSTRWRNIDRTLLSTVALAIISLCALFVSIYQTRVLALQQQIMTKSAKAQAWPNIEVSSINNGSINVLKFAIANTGTGPAIIENVSVRYDGANLRSWWDLWHLNILPDTIPQSLGTISTISNRVIQAGEQYDFLVIDNNRPLLEYIYKDMRAGKGPIVTVCYKSVFDDHWLLKTRIGASNAIRAAPTNACLSVESTTFTN